jgi:hypothetical protein
VARASPNGDITAQKGTCVTLVNSALGRPSATGEPIKSDAARVQRGDLFYEPGGLASGFFGGAHRQGWHPEPTPGGHHRSADRCHSTNPRARAGADWACDNATDEPRLLVSCTVLSTIA